MQIVMVATEEAVIQIRELEGVPAPHRVARTLLRMVSEDEISD